MERAVSAPSCLGRRVRDRSLMAAASSPRSWRISGHLRRSSASTGEVYANTMNVVAENDWKAFAERWREVAKEERRLTRLNPPTSREAIAWCLSSLRMYERMHGNPFVKDAVTRRKEAEAREAWALVRERWRM